MKQKFNIITSTCVPLPLENVDTDQIIPARFLKATTREEKFFGDNLFRDWRYNPDGSLNKDFVLNNPTYGGQILVAGKNFGSGSSRDKAAWAIARYLSLFQLFSCPRAGSGGSMGVRRLQIKKKKNDGLNYKKTSKLIKIFMK